MTRVAIQAALDTTDLDLALAIARSISGSVERIEVGTLLLHQYGMRAIESLRDAVGTTTLVADCKIMDCGYTVAMMATNAGADGVTVQGVAPRATLEAVCRAAQEQNAFVMVDGLGVTDIGHLRAQLQGLLVDHVIIHFGKDEQALHEAIPVEKIQYAADESLPPLAVAGGLSPINLRPIIREAQVDLIIVGGAIVASQDPASIVAALRQVCDHERGAV